MPFPSYLRTILSAGDGTQITCYIQWPHPDTGYKHCLCSPLRCQAKCNTSPFIKATWGNECCKRSCCILSCCPESMPFLTRLFSVSWIWGMVHHSSLILFSFFFYCFKLYVSEQQHHQYRVLHLIMSRLFQATVHLSYFMKVCHREPK